MMQYILLDADCWTEILYLLVFSSSLVDTRLFFVFVFDTRCGCPFFILFLWQKDWRRLQMS